MNYYTNNKQISRISFDFDAAGDIYVVGNFKGSVDLIPGPIDSIFTAAKRAFFISKYDRRGNYKWIKVVTGEESEVDDIEITNDGTIYLVGNHTGEVNFNPDTTDQIHITGSGSFGYVLKIDTLGYVTDYRRFQAALAFSEATFIESDANNNIYIAGTYKDDLDIDLRPFKRRFLQSAVGFDGFVAKYDKDLNLEWGESLGWTSGSTWIEDIVIDSDENAYVIGNFSGTIDFDEDEQIKSKGRTDIFIAKRPHLGSNWEWYKTFGGSGKDFATSIDIQEDNEKTLLFSGVFEEEMRIDSAGSTITLSAQTKDGVFVTLDDQGRFKNVKKLGGTSSGYILAADKVEGKNEIKILGSFAGDLPYGNGATAIALGQESLFIGTVDFEGNLKEVIPFANAQSFEPPNNLFKDFASIEINEDGELFLSSDLYNETNFDFQNFDLNLPIEDNCYNSYFLKFSKSSVSVKNNDSKRQTTKIFPNPSQGIITLENIQLPIQFSIFDLNGNQIIQEILNKNQIDLRSIKEGIYFLRLSNSTHAEIHKVILEK